MRIEALRDSEDGEKLAEPNRAYISVIRACAADATLLDILGYIRKASLRLLDKTEFLRHCRCLWDGCCSKRGFGIAREKGKLPPVDRNVALASELLASHITKACESLLSNLPKTGDQK